MATLNAIVGGMTCGACARRVEHALAGVAGARSARVDIAARTATVEHDGTTSFRSLRAAVEGAGYTLESATAARLTVVWFRSLARRPVIVGPAAGLALLGLYFGLIALAQGWEHALHQFEQDGPFVLACCVHHVTDVLPILGVSGLAVVLGAYKTPMLWLGLAMNLAGIAYLGWQLQHRVATPSASTNLSEGVNPS